jgi:hypothetical protein
MWKDTKYGWTLLSWAAINGREGVVKVATVKDSEEQRFFI